MAEDSSRKNDLSGDFHQMVEEHDEEKEIGEVAEKGRVLNTNHKPHG